MPHVLCEPVELVCLRLAIVLAVILDERRQGVDQLFTAWRVQTRFDADVQGLGAVAGPIVHLLHKLERAEGAGLVGHEVAVGDHGFVEVVLVFDEGVEMVFSDHPVLKFIYKAQNT